MKDPIVASKETTLYRKYRPQIFNDVIGQDHIVKTLESAIKLGNVAHAYLFSGSRGTGKTSVARILARQINTSVNDLYEIDAASNRGIDDIRELRDSVSTLPFESKYKVYIIDEVHMLTKEAFNALLKTLEEPPAHVIFILATTELEKLPDTIISRCQSFVFKKPNLAMLKEEVMIISKKEGFTLLPASAELIALLGDGSFRDTQSILQKVLSASSDKKISIEEVEMVTGAPKGDLVNMCISALAEKDLARALGSIAQATANNIDSKVFLRLILREVRRVLLLKYAPEMENEMSLCILNQLSQKRGVVLLQKRSKRSLVHIQRRANLQLASYLSSLHSLLS
jgi:DNA polymerase-3 subunit gamma/tau